MSFCIAIATYIFSAKMAALLHIYICELTYNVVSFELLVPEKANWRSQKLFPSSKKEKMNTKVRPFNFLFSWQNGKSADPRVTVLQLAVRDGSTFSVRMIGPFVCCRICQYFNTVTD